MVKQKKKRTKKYTGADAATSRPVVTRINAVKRNKLQLWWLEKKRIARPVLIAIGAAGGVTWLIFEFIRLASGSAA